MVIFTPEMSLSDASTITLVCLHFIRHNIGRSQGLALEFLACLTAHRFYGL